MSHKDSIQLAVLTDQRDGQEKFAEHVLAETVQIYYRRIQELEEKLGLMDTEIQQIASTAPYAERVARSRCFPRGSTI